MMLIAQPVVARGSTILFALLTFSFSSSERDCVAGEPPSAHAKSVHTLEETANGSVAVPAAATDLDCYARTIETTNWRNDSFAPDAATTATMTARTRRRVAVAILGELPRVTPHTTIGDRVVAPLTRRGDSVTVILSTTRDKARVPAMRMNAGAHRFARMPRFDGSAASARVTALVAHFRTAGAVAVHACVWEFARMPPLMPSPPGARRFRENQMSFVLHCLVHSLLWRDVEAAERAAAQPFDVVLSLRNDALWLREFPSRGALAAGRLDATADAAAAGDDGDAVLTKACLAWGGYNDKFAVLPRRFAAPWMRLLEAYYDPSFFQYKNSEELQKLVAMRHTIPVRELHRVFDTVDFYHWGEDDAGRHGCVPEYYSGVLRDNEKVCACFRSAVCDEVRLRLCKHNSKLYSRDPGDAEHTHTSFQAPIVEFNRAERANGAFRRRSKRRR